MEEQQSGIVELNERSREVFRRLVETYVETGEPVGSRTLSRALPMKLSPATIRNVMSDLEHAGLLFSPHTSAGRLPTELGLKMFVSGLLQVGQLTETERNSIDAQCNASNRNLEDVLNEATSALSGLSRCAGMVLSPKRESPLRQIEFVQLGDGRALAVLVSENGVVENRVFDVPVGLPANALVEAANYLSAQLRGRTLSEAAVRVRKDLDMQRNELDDLTRNVVDAGLATWSGDDNNGALIIRGQANLLEDVNALEDLEKIRALFQALEEKETMLRLLDLADQAEGVQIFIGAENKLFGLSGCSVVVSPFRDSTEQIVGAVGVIGPTRLNYARIIPMVDYTARVVGRLLG
jgi:heat-inducible transcriptional repressor